jgi:anti-sigma-K factor RskA
VDLPPPKPAGDEDEPVPIFGTWRGIYTAVILVAVACIALTAVFSNWPY